MTSTLEAELENGGTSEDALRTPLSQESRAVRIVFNGDGYSEEWHHEAEQRGLLNLPTTLTLDAREYLHSKNVALFEKYGALSPRELESRREIAYD